jgi:hypothetical protein
MKESISRTLVPLVYVLLLKAGAAKLGVDDATTQALAALIVTGAIYVTVRVVEQRWPMVGIVLGWPKSPTYDKAA